MPWLSAHHTVIAPDLLGHGRVHVTVRGLIDLGGQRVSAIDRLYLAAELPTLIVWGDRDPLIVASVVDFVQCRESAARPRSPDRPRSCCHGVGTGPTMSALWPSTSRSPPRSTRSA
jgi:pimeloyl-ACP methyl ester carboxylesterase